MHFTFLDSGVSQSFIRSQTPVPTTPFDNQRDENPATRRHVAEVTVGVAATVAPRSGTAILPRFSVKTATYDSSQPAVLRNGQPMLATADIFQSNERFITLDGNGTIAAEPTPGSVWVGNMQNGAIVETETRTASLAIARPLNPTGGETNLTLDLIAIPVSRNGASVATLDPLQERWRLHDGKGDWPRLLGFWLFPVKLWQFTEDGTESSADIDVVLMRKEPRDARPPVDSTGIVRLRLTATADGKGRVEVVPAANNAASAFDFTFAPPAESVGKGIVRIAGTLPAQTVDFNSPLNGNLTKLVLAYPAGALTYDYPTTGPSAQLAVGAATFAVPQRVDGNRTTKISQTTIAPNTEGAEPKGFGFNLTWREATRSWLLVWSAKDDDPSPAWSFLLTVGSDANSMTIPLDAGEALGNLRVVFKPSGPVVESDSVKQNSWWKRDDSVVDGGLVVASFTADGGAVTLSGQLLSHLVDRNPTGAPRPSKLVATIDLSADPTADVVLTGVFAVPNHLQFVPATGPATYAHSVAVYVDQANMPSESVFLGLFSASAQPIAAIVEHQLTLPDNTIRTWQVPQMLRPVAIPAALSADPALLGFDAGAVLLLRASVDDSATPGSQGPPTIERPGFMSLRLVPRLVGRFEPSRGINILELRLPALLALKATGTPPSIKVPAHPIAPTAPGSFRFITAGTQPPTTDPGPDVSSPTVQFIRRDPLARYLRADVLAGAIGPTSGQPWSKPTYRENSKLLFLPTILPELAAVGGLGQKVLDAGFVVSAPPLAGGSLVLTRPLVIEAAVTVTQDAGSTVAARRRLDASLCVDAQLGAFIARDLVLVAHDRVDSDLIGWGQQQLAPLRTSDGGIVVSDFAEVTAIPAPPESGARDGVWGHQAPAPDQPLIVGATDSRSALPGAGFAPTVPAAFCGLAEFDAGPSPANDRGQCISGVRHRLAPTWEGQYWRVQPVELLAAGAAQFATLLKAPQNPQRQAVRDALPSTSDFGTVLTVLAAGTGSNAEATILARELNLLIQADGTFAVIQADSPPPHDYNARFRARREALSVLFGDTLPPPAGQRRFANRFRPARTVSGMANVLAVTHDEQTPFVKDPYRTADLTLPMLTGVMQRSGPEAPSDPMPSLLPPLIDVVAWSARPGETGTDRWSVHEYVFPATGGTRARYGQSQQAVASLRRPRARAGRDEKIDLQCFPSKPLFSNRFIFTKFNLKQTLGESVIPDSVAQKPFAAINAVGVDRTHFQAAVKDVRLAPTCPVIFLYEGTSAAPKVQDVAIFLVVNPHYQARSDKSVKLLLSNGTVTPPITVPDLRTFLCFNLGGTIGNLPIALPFASPPTPEDMLQNPPPPYVNPIADSNMLLEIPNPGTDASWLLLGDPAIAEQMSIPLDTDKAPASKIYTGGMPGSFALGVLTFRLDVGTAGSNGAVNPPSQWKWTQADPSAVPPATAQTELFIDFVNKAGSIIPPKMSAAILAWPGQLQGQADPDQSLVLAGYRLMDDRDFSPITPFPGDAPNLVAWVRQAALESLLRAPGQINDNATDPIYRFDIVVTGSSGELIPTNSIS